MRNNTYWRLRNLQQGLRHFKPRTREKAAIIAFRSRGYNIHNIARALGRSTSYVYRVIAKAQALGALRRFDNRKIHTQAKQYLSHKKQALAFYWIRRWQGFIFGAEEEPP